MSESKQRGTFAERQAAALEHSEYVAKRQREYNESIIEYVQSFIPKHLEDMSKWKLFNIDCTQLYVHMMRNDVYQAQRKLYVPAEV